MCSAATEVAWFVESVGAVESLESWAMSPFWIVSNLAGCFEYRLRR
jgi:hypothetical protein